MEKLSNFYPCIDDFITSDKILYFCENLNNKEIQYIKTDFIKHRNQNQNNNIININNWRNLNKNINIKDIKILISGHSDYDVSINELDILNNNYLKIWFCENLNINHSKLYSIPIGIPNKDEDWVPYKEHPNYYKIIGNTDLLYNISKTSKKIKNLVYMNFSIITYSLERQLVFDLYNNKNWVTLNNNDITEKGYNNYLDEIYSHKFVFAPRGNGIDTHRIWESLYLRSIPIVKKCIGMEQFYDLPILFVDDWNNITEDFLNEKYHEIINKEYPLEKLKIDYWLNLIKNSLILY